MTNKVLQASLLALSLAACGPSDPPSDPKPPQGRAETRGIRNVDAIGVPGSAIANKVDGALNASEESARKLREQAQTQSGETAP